MCGLIAVSRSFADASFDRPTSGVPWMICRCRLLKSTTSKSTMPIRPTPAAARYIAAGEPRPPAPMQSTLPAFSSPLTVHADLRHDQMPAVALDLVVGEFGQVAMPVSRAGRSNVLESDAACHRRNDADRVARRDRRLLLLQVADVFVVQVDVDEAAQLALIVVQVRLQAGVLRRQIGQQLADRCAVGLDRVLLIGVRSQRGRDQDFRRHSARPRRNWNGLLSGTTQSSRVPRPP